MSEYIMTEEQKKELISKLTNWVAAALAVGAFCGYWAGKLL